MVNVKKIKAMVEPQVWERGKSYFEGGAVIDLEDEGGGQWEAIVSGNDDYEVSVDIQFDQLQEWECDCPYEGNVCKHVVAAILAIREKQETDSKEIRGKDSKPKIFEQLVDSVSADELRQFVIQYASENRNFKQDFKVYLAEKNPAGGNPNYGRLIVQSLHSGMDKHGFIDYYQAPKAFRTVYSLLDKAESFKSDKNFTGVWEIASAILEQVSEVTDSTDDSDGMIADSFDGAFNLIYFLIEEREVPMSLKEKIFDWHKTEIIQSKYENYGEDLLLDSMVDLAEVTNQINEVFPLLDEKIKKADREYGLTTLLQKKAQLLKSSGRLAEYVSLIHDNMQLPEFRKMKVDELMEQKRMDEAATLIIEGIRISDKLSHIGTTMQWKVQLLGIYKESGKTDQYLVLLRELFYHSPRQYYELLKTTVGAEKWPEERAQVIANLKKNRRDWYFLYDLYAAEQMLPELMQLIAQSPSFSLIKTYEPLLFPVYPAEIIDLYRQICEQYAAQANSRGNYQELASMLKHVMKKDGGKPVVTMLVATFRELYKRRPAMMDELKGLY